MTKLMVFIDGTWLYHSKYKLGGSAGSEDYALDYGKLPSVVCRQVGKLLGSRETDTIRTTLFGSCAWNYDPRDEDMVQRQKDFFAMLTEKYHYEVEIFPIDFRGRRLRRADRRPDDTFEPREKCVDISLASNLLYYAAIPGAYDVAVCILGDQDFVPALQAVRRLGKRVAIASIKASCSPEFSDPYDEARVKDFDVVWLDELVEELELNPSRFRARAEVQHDAIPSIGYVNGNGNGLTAANNRVQTWSPHDDRYEDLRADDAFENRNGVGSRDGSRSSGDDSDDDGDDSETFDDEFGDFEDGTEHFVSATEPGGDLIGYVKTKFDDRGYGFIHGDDGQDYFFHVSDLRDGLEFHQMEDGLPVVFQVRKKPEYDKAGASQNVRLPTDFDDLGSDHTVDYADAPRSNSRA